MPLEIRFADQAPTVGPCFPKMTPIGSRAIEKSGLDTGRKKGRSMSSDGFDGASGDESREGVRTGANAEKRGRTAREMRREYPVRAAAERRRTGGGTEAFRLASKSERARRETFQNPVEGTKSCSRYSFGGRVKSLENTTVSGDRGASACGSSRVSRFCQPSFFRPPTRSAAAMRECETHRKNGVVVRRKRAGREASDRVRATRRRSLRETSKGLRTGLTMGKGKRDGRRAGSVRGRIGRGRKGVRGRVGIWPLRGNRRGLEKTRKGSKGLERIRKYGEKRSEKSRPEVDQSRCEAAQKRERCTSQSPRASNPKSVTKVVSQSPQSRRKEDAERDAEPAVNRGQTDRERTLKKGLKVALRLLENDANDASDAGSAGECNGSEKVVEKR